MKKLYSILIAIVALMVFGSLALSDPGTTWQNKIDTPGRFTLLSAFDNDAVFDRETGRVWEQSPSTTMFTTWFDALDHCYTLEVGGRKGWRLPTVEELASLIDTSQLNPDFKPALPPRNPFSNVQGGNGTNGYWTATTNARNQSFVWRVEFGTGRLTNAENKSFELQDFAWCVRGGQGIDGVQNLPTP